MLEAQEKLDKLISWSQGIISHNLKKNKSPRDIGEDQKMGRGSGLYSQYEWGLGFNLQSCENYDKIDEEYSVTTPWNN